MATVMCGSQVRATPMRACMTDVGSVRCAELIQTHEMPAIVSFDARIAPLIDQRVFLAIETASRRAAPSHETDHVGSGFAARTRARISARAGGQQV